MIVTYKEWMKKGSRKKKWNGVRVEEEEREDLEIRGCRRLHQCERGELTTWNGSTEECGE